MRFTLAVVVAFSTMCGPGEAVVQKGDMSRTGGSPTIRRAYALPSDDPATSNDETNDQPSGYFGTVTVTVTSGSSGNTYTVDADMDGQELQRIYFPKGGWVDFPDCELEEDLTGDCEDEEGRSWTFEGEA